jgi:hypothetical protein
LSSGLKFYRLQVWEIQGFEDSPKFD